MRSIFTFTIAAFILTACSQTSITSTPLPDSSTLNSTSTLQLTETETSTSTATAMAIPEKIVAEGSEAAMAGIPVGAELRGDAYFYTNSVNSREVLVAKMVDGKIVKEEFLNHKLVSCTASQEEILANELPGDFADSGGANKIAMFTDNEKFPEDVLTGQPIEKIDRTDTSGAEFSSLRWSREAQLFFDANPEKIPHQIMGCFSRKSSIDGFTYIGIVHKWKNSDETYRYITTYLRDLGFFNYLPDQLVFVMGWYTPGNTPAPYKFIVGLVSDPERSNILTKWADPQSNYSVPPEAENSAFTATGPELDYRK